MRATREQEIAIQTEGRALLVEAGAGTGKTSVLVQRFVHLLDRHPEWPIESLIAVTFTKKATREMRGRIRKSVEEKAQDAPPASHWHEQRRTLERLQVSTIHSLCARLLRENAIAAGIDPLFEELDEQQADLLKDRAITKTLNELVEEDHTALDLLASLRVGDLRQEMADLLSKRGTVHRLFRELGNEEDLLERWQSGLEEMRQGMWEDTLHSQPSLISALEELPAIQISDPQDKLAPAVEAAQKGCEHALAGDYVNAIRSWSKINRSGGKQANWGGKEALAELKDLLKIPQEAAKKLEKDGFTKEISDQDRAAVQALQLWKALWERLNQNYDALKEEQAVLDFDDLEILAERLLYQEPRSKRLQAFKEGINHLMVDEFQDTNQVQQSIMYGLAHPQEPGRLFVVGDAKQSIYRFRQAQVSVFNRTGKDIQEVTGETAVSLAKSFRTHHSLLSALNKLFEVVLRPLSETYADYEAPPGSLSAERLAWESQPVAPAPVELLLLPDQDDDGERINAQDGRAWEARLLAERLLALEREEYQIWDKDQEAYRPFKFKDAVVLFRATTDLPLYEEIFKSYGLPYLTVSGRGYYNRPEVQDLIALLMALDNPGDDLSLAAALRSPLFSLSDETLYRLRWRNADNNHVQQPVSYACALGNPPPTGQPDEVLFAAQVMDKLWTIVRRVPVRELLRRAFDETGYEAVLTLSDRSLGGGGRQRSNILKLLEKARDWNVPSLSEFLRTVRDFKAREVREGEALGDSAESEAVQLMSIHAAKGLEFPVVLLADLGRDQRASNSSPHLLHDPAFGIVCKQRDASGDWQKPGGYVWGEWLNGQMEAAESKRLLYVACTRAADLLVLSGKNGNTQSWLAEILEAWEISEGGPDEEIIPCRDFSIRVTRPSVQPEDRTRPARALPESPGVQEVPALVHPISNTEHSRTVSVTELAQKWAGDAGELARIRPAVDRSSIEQDSGSAPAHLVGNLVHRALANWECLSLPQKDLKRKLAGYAHWEGVLSPAGVADAVGRASRMIGNLRDHPLFQEIDGAEERYSELPFTLDTSISVIDGVIDLLYKDRDGNWFLLDWKTDFLVEDQIEAESRQHLPQMALYALALQRTVKAGLSVFLCYLNPRLKLYHFGNEELARAAERYFDKSRGLGG